MIFIFGKQRIFTKILTELYVRDVCERTELCTCCPCSDRTANVLMVRVQNYECVAYAGTGAANAYSKRNIENPFPGFQMFVKARNKKCAQQSLTFISMY